MTDPSATRPSGYPVDVDVEPQLSGRNRTTTFFRLILGIPHILIIGGIANVGIGFGGARGAGALAGAAFTMAVIAWFALVFTGRHPRGLWDFCAYYLRWLVRASAYLGLLRDDYPPFGDVAYPTTLGVEYPEAGRDRWSVGQRIIYAIPHAIVLFFVNIAWFVVTVVAWISILLTGEYPPTLYRFSVGALRWNVRVESYLLLMRDEYPPFRMAP